VDEDFPGGSFIFAPDGSLLAAAEDWRETLLVYELDLPDAAAG
jgi:predicted amidohydrolase